MGQLRLTNFFLKSIKLYFLPFTWTYYQIRRFFDKE